MAAAPGLREAVVVAENTVRERLLHETSGSDGYQRLDWALSVIHVALSNAA